jgi:acyl-CoA synthetase (AMP-forming)/AMP-acid ligase II
LLDESSPAVTARQDTAMPELDLLHRFTLADVPREHRRSHPTRNAAVDGEVRLRWPELDDRVNRLANALLDDGVGRGDVVLWMGQNSRGVIECLLAAAKIGAVCAVANWRQSADELAFVIGDAAAKVVVWQEAEVGEAVATAREQVGDARGRWLQLDGSGGGSYETFLSSGSSVDPDVDVSGSDPVLMLYTAAFLGTPNGAMLSHDAVLVQSLMMANLQRIDASYVYLNSGPLFHVATFMTTLATLLFGGTNVFMARVEAEEFCRVVESEQCTGAFLMGPTMDQIIEINADRRFDISSLRSFPGKRAWNEMITVDDSPWATKPAGFGQTEVMGMLTFNALGGASEGNSGRPSPMVAVRILGPDGLEVGVGETGEICARGPQVMVGYHDRADENVRRQRGGWHHTNDLGRRETDGSLTFIGPKGRIVKSAAENIYPAEVEAAINAHDDVRESAVIGVPEKKWGQSVMAIVVLHDDRSLAEDALISFIKDRIASYKKPKAVVFRTDPIPRNGFPIDYDALDDEYGGGGYPGGG